MFFDGNQKMVGLYTKDKGFIDVKLSEDYFLDLLNLDDDEIIKMLENPGLKDKDGMSFDEYLFLCLTFYDRDFKLSPKKIGRLENLKSRFSDKVEYVCFIDGFLNRSEKVGSLDFEINRELMEALNKNINPKYNQKEKIVYYYFKLCFLLQADVRYNFCSLISSFFNKTYYEKSSNNLGRITPINNQVCCFEFDEIMKKLIEAEKGIVEKYKFSGNSQHVCTKSVVDRTFMMLDAFQDPVDMGGVGRDIVGVRANKGYNGVVLNSDALMYGIVDRYSWVDKIYDDVQEEFAWYKSRSKFSKEEMDYCFEIVDDLKVGQDIKNRIKFYFSEVNKIPFTGVSFFGNVINSHIILEEDKEKIALTGVCSYFDDCGLEVVMSIRQDDESMVYFMFGDNIELNVYTKDEIKQMISEDKIIITHRERLNFDGNNLCLEECYFFIPGIDEDIQKEGNKCAEKVILPKVVKRVYQESLGEECSVYTKVMEELD